MGPGSTSCGQAGPFILTEEVRARFDLVSFDPRGIFRSRPLRCFESPAQWEPYFTPFAFPITPAETQERIAADRYLLRACDQRAGAIINHMATADVARDMDLLRAALGDARLNYVGYSYGSYLGVTYANLFPDRFRALVVDGVLDPVAWSTGAGNSARTQPFSTRLRSDAGAQATLDEFFRLCDAAGPQACAFAPRSKARYADLADRLRDDPAKLVDPFTGEVFDYNYSFLVADTLGAMYFSPDWPFLAEFLAFLDANVDPDAAGAALLAFRHQLGVTDPTFDRYQNQIEGGPGRVLLGLRQPGQLRRLEHGGQARPTASSATSGGPGHGSPACAPSGGARTRRGTWGRSPPTRSRRSSSSGPSSIPPPATRARGPWPACCRIPGS